MSVSDAIVIVFSAQIIGCYLIYAVCLLLIKLGSEVAVGTSRNAVMFAMLFGLMAILSKAFL